MVDEEDGTIIQTSLREMEEELGISPDKVEVLGILRCDWILYKSRNWKTMAAKLWKRRIWQA